MPSPPPDVFVSYTHTDRAWAEWIAWVLEEAGYSVAIQAWDFRPGGNFVLSMQEATAARHTLPVLSPSYLAAEYTQPEWAAAFARDPQGKDRALSGTEGRRRGICSSTASTSPMRPWPWKTTSP